jgi:hypothetical protein
VESLTTSAERIVVTILFWLTGATATQVPSGATGDSSTPLERGGQQLPHPGLDGGQAARVGGGGADEPVLAPAAQHVRRAYGVGAVVGHREQESLQVAAGQAGQGRPGGLGQPAPHTLLR